MEKGMEKEKNIIMMVNQNLMENLIMEKGMEKGKNIMMIIK